MKNLNNLNPWQTPSTLRLGIAFLLLTVVVTASAAPISLQQAQQRAAAFLKNKRGAKKLTPVTSGARLAPRHTLPPTATNLYYVFDRGENEGFVIISGDDQTPAVLGYTESGCFDYSILPENMREWLDDRAQQIAAVQQQGLTASELPVAALKQHDPIDALMVTKWNQGSPYNLYCPNYFRMGTSVTGCVATAMAQILYYHHENAPKELLDDIPDYTITNSHPTYGDLHVKGYPAGSPIDWDNMQPTYNSNSTPQQKRAVAELMSYCGTAVRMGYSNGSSGAYSSDVPDALQKYFGYSSSCKLISRSDMTEEKFDETVYAQLAKGDPVYLSGSNGSGGHAFVCDGYDGEFCYHINWGWGGGGPDGFYLLATLNPGSQGIGGSDGGYSGGQAAVIGIHMDNWSEKAISFSDSRVRTICLEKWDTDGNGKLSYGEAAAVTELGDAFKGSQLRNFNELYFFTSLKELPTEAFAGCTTLSAIRLPKNLTTINVRAFEGCSALKTVNVNATLRSIGEAAFAGCTKLAAIDLPDGVDALAARTFENCTALTALTLPPTLISIGDRAFAGCTKLSAVTFESLQPQAVRLGQELFDGVNLADVQLTVAQGTDAYFAATEPWNAFGNKTSKRNMASGKVLPLTEDKLVYLYNIGTHSYLTKGEANETQGVVGSEPMRYRIGHTDAMPEGTYYLYSDDMGSTNHYFYRLNSNSDVGRGVMATFVNGSASRNTAHDMSAWWCIRQVHEGIYTLQTPADAKGYVEGEFLGTDRNHASNFTSPTAGVYTDISYADHPQDCQWMFIEYDEDAVAVNDAAVVLGNLLALAEEADVNVHVEKAVYDKMDATVEELRVAQDRVRKKLGIITFEDKAVREVCLNYWDLDEDGELTSYEIGGVPDINTRFQSSKMTAFDEFQYFIGCTSVPSKAFYGCNKLGNIALPKNIISIGSNAFQNCSVLKEIELPAYITEIGDAAFQSCKALESVRLHVTDPKYISLKDNAFQNVDLSKATLYVPQGTSQLYAEAPVWKKFGTIKEMRSTTQPAFSQFNINEDGYVYNIGMRKYISRGEAYGTQAVVAQEGMVYQFKRAATGGKTYYYLYSEETGNSNKNLFRSEEDSKVGTGVRTCFVDGGSNRLSDRSAYWNLEYVEGEQPYFTMQVPSSFKEYVEGQYLGVDLSHTTKAVSGTTQGLYWDVERENNEANCLWAWVSLEDVQKARRFDEEVAQLKRYLQLAYERSIDATDEQTVYDNLNATQEEILAAVDALREKLHFVRFDSDAVKQLCVSNWDYDIDGEMSYDELAAITNLEEVFRGHTNILSLEELQLFTALTEIPDNAFRNNSQLISLYLPAKVTKVGEKAFSSCNKLKYLAILNPSATPVDAATSSLPSGITVFVPAEALNAYQQDEFWSRYSIQEYTGVPTVTPDTLSRTYGNNNARLTYTVSGAPINGTPVLSTEITATTPVGDYPIVIEAGSITSQGLQLRNGVYHVNPATLTVTGQSYTREIGEEKPTFEYTIKGFKNKETEEVLTAQPVAECDATADSSWGEYEIRLSGGQAQNYVFEYIPDTLTINPPESIHDLSAAERRQPVFDLTGRRVGNSYLDLHQLPRGIYIIAGRRVAIQ